ncbi:MAG: hypothetical protein UU43_C0009G0011 [Candidatus Falkowbacteria bacterium GW2011_GWA2_41_14]|uniref:Uncharacterized protein n=1 Tax=Candidatus Falkowbacteria bacterium GW2011_GWA2_41_14 TaxID=1618635 RepID=A0A0G0URG0_9BACT|nr:MAG: hypothetical protein UU43_C0009G0011 [Candidatus Falkowbacteria bacterium GW2011_GWA2_41_14]
MKKKTLVGLILAVAIFSPILIPISVALLALVLVVWIFLCLCAMAMGVIAQVTFNGCHRRLVRELHKIGAPPSESEAEDLYGCSNPHHADECTPRTCEIRRAEESWRLTYACGQAHVPGWRVRWTAA